ncbi:N-acetylmuramoyl-L-alanine amidase [Selenomonadales bacterium OttesenSCG-928-I06]|nr:N-acetylmuramoyl-L-alanine amidase [Selenomonadales bacterium OttesenSCG-928-I06]
MRILLLKKKRIRMLLFVISLLGLNVFNAVYLIDTNIEDLLNLNNIKQASLTAGSYDFNSISLESLAGKTIVLDPGHGGIDNGAKRYKVQEKSINLNIALKLCEILRENQANVILTREDDLDYYTQGKGGKRNDILKRIEIIEQANPDIFVSIHCNASTDSRWYGAQVFYNSQVAESAEIADIMQYALKNFPQGNKRKAKEDSNILMLKSINIPGVLIETGFISNQKEALALSNEEYQKNLAVQIAKALAYYFSQREQAN